MSMARDVWRWCKVHQKWLQDVNACVTQEGLEHVKTDSAPRSFSPSSRSVFSSRLDCIESSGKKLHKGSVAASNRWRDDSNTLDPVPHFTTKKDKKQGCSQSQEPLMSLPKSLGTGLQECSPAPALPTEDLADIASVWPQTSASRYRRPVKWLFAEAPMQNNFRQSTGEIDNWVTVFSSIPDHDPGGGPDRFDTSEPLNVIREFEKCGTIVERVFGPDGANWIQLQYQSSQEAGQALMKSGLRLKGGTTVICRNLDEKQRKQLLLATISKSGNHLGPGPSSSYLPKSHGSVDGNFSEEELPKSSLSKFVDLVFDSDRYFQISPAGYIIPIRFEPGLYKELFKSQIHRCDAFVTPQCDPAANQPLFFEYPWKPTDPCNYTLRKIEELQDQALEGLASSMPSQGLTSRPTGKTCCDENTWRNNDLVNHSQMCHYRDLNDREPLPNPDFPKKPELRASED